MEFETWVLSWPHVTTRFMFGCPAYLAKGKLFAILITDGIVITRLDEMTREKFASEREAVPFQAGSKLIKTWSHVPISGEEDLHELVCYVKQSYQAALEKVY